VLAFTLTALGATTAKIRWRKSSFCYVYCTLRPLTHSPLNSILQDCVRTMYALPLTRLPCLVVKSTPLQLYAPLFRSPLQLAPQICHIGSRRVVTSALAQRLKFPGVNSCHSNSGVSGAAYGSRVVAHSGPTGRRCRLQWYAHAQVPQRTAALQQHQHSTHGERARQVQPAQTTVVRSGRHSADREQCLVTQARAALHVQRLQLGAGLYQRGNRGRSQALAVDEHHALQLSAALC
jgi:hypothetical protein